MKSAVLPSFWEEYKSLDKKVQESARKAFEYGLKIHSTLPCISSASIQKKISGQSESQSTIAL